MDIDTTSCIFGQTPRYFTTFDGSSSHWCLMGYDAIYFAYNTTFRIYVTNLIGWNATNMITYANSYSWNVNWVGMYN